VTTGLSHMQAWERSYPELRLRYVNGSGTAWVPTLLSPETTLICVGHGCVRNRSPFALGRHAVPRLSHLELLPLGLALEVQCEPPAIRCMLAVFGSFSHPCPQESSLRRIIAPRPDAPRVFLAARNSLNALQQDSTRRVGNRKASQRRPPAAGCVLEKPPLKGFQLRAHHNSERDPQARRRFTRRCVSGPSVGNLTLSRAFAHVG
jgi:hypothetical protein